MNNVDHLYLEGMYPKSATDAQIKEFIDHCIVQKAGERFDDDYMIGGITWSKVDERHWQAIAVIEYHGEVDNG